MTGRQIRVVLIDDSEADNFLHRRALETSGLVSEIVIHPDPERGLEHLRGLAADGAEPPDLLLLDINMPRMTGWEFLDAYRTLPAGHRARTVLYLLSATSNAADHERAARHDVVDGIRTKSLTDEVLREIIADHFDDEHPNATTPP
ncbi:MAG: response regulator [Actinomycetota bacterium]